MKWSQVLGVALGALVLSTSPAFPVAQQMGAGDTALIFGGSDAEGGIGDWYLGNSVVEAIIDHVGVQTDLIGVVPPGQEPQAQSEINPTGGTIIDLARVGSDGDQLPQFFTVGGLSTSNFFLYNAISAPDANTIRVSGGILFPPVSVAPTPCLTVVTDYQALGTDPFLTITSTVTNGCGVNMGIQGLLDVFIWTQRGIIPFGGAGPIASNGGRGFDHAVLDLASPGAAIETPVYMGGPGVLDPDDGIVDTATSTTSGAVSYGLLGVSVVRDPDGPGGAGPDINAAVNQLFGVNGTLVTALGNNIVLVPGGVPAGGTLVYTRRIYVGDRNDVRSVSNDIFAELAARPLGLPVVNGTISGDIDAVDTPNVEATLLLTRLGRCTISLASCKTNADCTGGGGTCADPIPTTGQVPSAKITQIRTDAAGAFSGVVLPRGDYELVIESAERDGVTVSPVVVAAAANTPVVVPNLTARGTVAFTVTERSAGSPQIPARLTFKGVGATPDPRFNHDLTALSGATPLETETFGGTQAGSAGAAAGQGNVVYTGTGTGSIQLRPGTYDVYASRGMEYSVDLEQVTVTAAATTNVAFRIKRAVKTKGAISADFHVHSGRSLDTGAAVRDRVASFAAEGVEVMVATDHDMHTDYAPIITAFGQDSRMTSIIGNEVTGSVPAPPAFPNSFGHINAWPLPLDANAKRDGAIEDEFVAPNWNFSRLRAQGAEVIQYNHVRAGVSGITVIGFFNNIGCGRCENDVDTTCTLDTDCPAGPGQNCTCVGYQPDRTISTPPNDLLLDDGILGPGTTPNPNGDTNLDFDVMEIENAVKDTDFPGYRQVRFDWLSLLQQGIFKPATGVSDSHRITVEHAGWARSYVLGVGDDPAALNVTNFNTAIRAGAMLVGGGPYIEFTANCGPTKGGMGALVNCPAGSQVKLKIKVRTPAWMPIEEVRVIANGEIDPMTMVFDSTTTPPVRATPPNFEANGRTMRFRKTIKVTPTVDTYYIVEAGPKFPASINTLPVPPPIVDIVQPDVVPNSITNPIFIDTNNNATFDPPGLPVLLTASAEQIAPKGFWQRMTDQVWQIASRWSGEAVAQGGPGKMTGVTDEEKAEAVREGEYFPLHEFAIPADAAAAAGRKAEEAEQKVLEDAAGSSNGE